MQNDTTISTLNTLIETCKNGEAGFKAAAEDIRSAAYKQNFLEYARQRATFAAELQAEVQALGGEPEQSGTVAGSLHRGWIDVKSAITGKDEHAILAEAERGEDIAKAAYENALGESLPASIAAIVQRQAGQVRATHDAVRDARDREKVTTH